MEEKVLNEKESLELITQMLNNSKKNMEIGQGNALLFNGYYTTILSVLIFIIVSITDNNYWNFAWLLMFGQVPIRAYLDRKSQPKVITYTDRAIANVWQVMGWMFTITFVSIVIINYLFAPVIYYVLMLPLSLIYCGIGISITGIIVQERWMIYSPLIAFVFAIYILTMIVIGNYDYVSLWGLLFGLPCIFMMIIPGHILNNKAKKQCLKN